jgi:hypothetical protein
MIFLKAQKQVNLNEPKIEAYFCLWKEYTFSIIFFNHSTKDIDYLLLFLSYFLLCTNMRFHVSFHIVDCYSK